jgi:hypothetical protein
MTDFETGRDESTGSAWATGGVVFAATMMIMIGLFQVFQGLAAIIEDEFFLVLPNYAFDIDITGWGWIHLILGVLVTLAGFYLSAGSRVAGAVAIALAGLAALANFFFIPYYPFWSLLIIALAVFVIWAVARSGIYSEA